jgi:hypothetical protein
MAEEKIGNFKFQNCNGSGEIIIAYINNIHAPIHVGFKRESVSEIISFNTKIYSSIDDTVVGCYFLISETEDDAGNYYFSKRDEFKNCSDCNFSLGFDKLSSDSVTQKLQQSTINLIDILNNK